MFRTGSRTAVYGTGGNIKSTDLRTGQGSVFVIHGTKLRIVMSFQGEQDVFRSKYPSIQFAKAFLKKYKAINELK